MTTDAREPALFVDVQALQHPVSAGRGIGRYVGGLIGGLLRSGAPIAGLALNPKLPVPEHLPSIVRDSGLLTWNTVASFRRASESRPIVYLVGSPFEDVHPIDGLLPPYVAESGVPVVAILYDLIPLSFPDAYLSGEQTRESYNRRLELLQRADHLLAISSFTEHEAVRLLGIDEQRITTVGAGCESFFRPAHEVDDPGAIVRTRVPDLDQPFVLCVTATDERKNTETLLGAWAALDRNIRDGHRLVIACRLDEQTRHRWARQLRFLDTEDSVSFVDAPNDHELRALYQSASVLVAPSRHEGFGLPVLEAARCGCPAIVAAAGAAPEILSCPEGTFPPDDVDGLAALIARVLRDAELRARLTLAAADAADRHTWESVASATRGAIRSMPQPRRRRTPARAIAFVSADGDGSSTITRYHREVIRVLAHHVNVDWFSGAARSRDPGREPWAAFPTEAFGRVVSPARYDAIIYALGTGFDGETLVATAARAFPDTTWVHDPATADTAVLAASRVVLVDHPADAVEIGLRAGPLGTGAPVRDVPVAWPPAPDVAGQTPTRDLLVVLGDDVDGARSRALVEALAFVAPQRDVGVALPATVSDTALAQLTTLARAAGVEDRLEIVDTAITARQRVLADAALAVCVGPRQPADVVDVGCALSAGVGVVSDARAPFGAGAVWQVPPDLEAPALATELVALLQSSAARAALRAAAHEHAAAWDVADVASSILEALGIPPADGPRRVLAWDPGDVDSAPLTSPRQAADLAARLKTPIVVVDAGCRWGFADRWLDLGSTVRLYGFDPDEDECRRLQLEYQHRPEVTVVPAALARTAGRGQLFVTREPGCASMFPPGEATLRHPAMAPMRLAGVEDIETMTLDDWAADAGVTHVDVIKADVQGGELDVLRGGERVLPTVRALELEVEFNPLYEGQPLFGDIDRYLRERGFVLWSLQHLVHYAQDATTRAVVGTDIQYFDDVGVTFPSRSGQLFWGMALYVHADVANPAQVDDVARLEKDACLLAALGCHDLAGITLARAASLGAPTPVADGDVAAAPA